MIQIVPILIWAVRAYAIYLEVEAARETAALIQHYLEIIRESRITIRKTIEELTQEIEKASSFFAAVDPGGNPTVARTGKNIPANENKNETFKEYIGRKIPFRPAISMVCMFAKEHPMTIQITSKKTKKVVETIEKIADKLEEYEIIKVKKVDQKQLMASLIFESIDEALSWKSPLKAEPNYYPHTTEPMLACDYPKSKNSDETCKSCRSHDICGSSKEECTRPYRLVQITPFFPRPTMPSFHTTDGSPVINEKTGKQVVNMARAPDLAITEYRNKKFQESNILCLVEIKFPNDPIKQDQIDSYLSFVQNKSGRLALLRVPEDCTGYKSDDKTQTQGQSDSPSGKPKGR